jgi:hypothetical protein
VDEAGWCWDGAEDTGALPTGGPTFSPSKVSGRGVVDDELFGLNCVSVEVLDLVFGVIRRMAPYLGQGPHKRVWRDVTLHPSNSFLKS